MISLKEIIYEVLNEAVISVSDLDDTLDYEDEYKDIEISNKQIEKINNEYNKYNKNKTNTTNIFNS